MAPSEFQSDDKLITLFLASLKLEVNFDNDYVKVGVVCPTIFFIHIGLIEVTLKDETEPFLILDDGCYFIDASFLFDLNNKYVYENKSENQA